MSHEAAAIPPPPPAQRSGSSRKSVSRSRLGNMLLLPVLGLGWLSWLILLAGCSAVNSVITNDVESANLLSLSWVVCFAFLLLLLIATALAVLSLRNAAYMRNGARGLLFLLAILIAWGGVAASTALEFNRNPFRADGLDNRAGTWAAGLIMMLITCTLLAVLLLFLDMHASMRLHDRTTSVEHAPGGEAMPSGGVHKSVEHPQPMLQQPQQQQQPVMQQPVMQQQPQMVQQQPTQQEQPTPPQYGGVAQQVPTGQPQYVGPAVPVQQQAM